MFFDASAQWVVSVGDRFVLGVGVDADQLVLQVVLKTFFEFAVFASGFFNQVAAFVVLKVFVTLSQQAVAFAQARRVMWAFADAEDIACRVKVEKLWVCAFGAFEPVEGVVEVAGFFIRLTQSNGKFS